MKANADSRVAPIFRSEIAKPSSKVLRLLVETSCIATLLPALQDCSLSALFLHRLHNLNLEHLANVTLQVFL
jgi:hypothetical protein